MNDNKDNDASFLSDTSSPKTGPAIPKKPGLFQRGLIGLLCILMLAWACVTYLPRYMHTQSSSNQDIAQIQRRLTDLEQKTQSLSDRMDGLNNSAAPVPSVGDIATQTNASKQSASDLVRLQSDLVALSSAMAALQNEVKETGAHAQLSQQATQSAISAAIAYIQLRTATMTDQPFTTELASMRDASPNDGDFQQALGKLQPIAATGAPTVAELRESLLPLEAPAAHATDKSEAQGWWDTFVVELKGLVSIRKLHGGGTDIFALIESDLAKNDLSAALNDSQQLPIEAQKVLSDWRSKLEARQTITETLETMTRYFNALAKPHPASGKP